MAFFRGIVPILFASARPIFDLRRIEFCGFISRGVGSASGTVGGSSRTGNETPAAAARPAIGPLVTETPFLLVFVFSGVGIGVRVDIFGEKQSVAAESEAKDERMETINIEDLSIIVFKALRPLRSFDDDS